MVLHEAIGIDPDSTGCVVCLVSRSGSPPIHRSFSLSSGGIEALLSFISNIPEVLLGIEGRGGQCRPLEHCFRRAGLPFYTIPAVNIASYRTAMIGAQKSNKDDARAVAEFLLDLETKGRLPAYACQDEPDEELRLLARERLRLGQQITVYQNRLWKLVKAASNDLYLAFRGNGDELTIKTSMTSARLLNLFVAVPDVSTWASLSEDQLLASTGGKRVSGWQNFLSIVHAPLALSTPISFALQLLLGSTAATLLHLLAQKKTLDAALASAVEQRPSIKALRDHYPGMGSFTVALLASEIITISRFPNDDHLASYGGLTKRSYSTGQNLNQRNPSSCNKRLKTAFITFAKCYLRCNTSSHLAHYHRHLLKQGMSHMEALKRIARALAREVFRFMKAQHQKAAQQKGKSVA